MNTYNYGVYGSGSTSYGGFVPIWSHIDDNGIEEAGGKFYVDPSANFADVYPAGTIIPAGTPVALSTPGGDLVVLKTYELAANIDASTTTVQFKKLGTALAPAVGDFLMKAPATVGTAGTGVEVKTVTVDASGFYAIDISESEFGTATAGDIFVQCDTSGAAAVIYAIPTGLLRREVYISADATSATGASVFHGTVLVDRIPPLPACVKAVLPMIKTEKG